MTLSIRRARWPDAVYLPAIERSAAARFRCDPELAWLADAEVIDAAQHRRNIEQQAVWVAVGSDGWVRGFITAECCGTALHVWEVSVDSAFQGQGIGTALLQAVVAHARQQGCRSLTLSTFRQLPWNEPFYWRFGFVTLPDAGLDSRLREVLAEEVRHGLPGARRCAMRLVLDDADSP